MNDTQSRPVYQLLVVWGDGLKTFDLPREGVATIGRAENNQVRIDHPSVSRRHARLRLGTPLLLEDLGGSNGTFVRDVSEPAAFGRTQQLRRLARESTEIGLGDHLMFGAVGAVLRRAPEPAADVGHGQVVLSEPMRLIHAQAARVAASTISVLILGETGVGKDRLARAIHGQSPRAGAPFLAINCATLGEHVLEGELFGYERGAFTGAVQARPGLFEAADGGTVFLDEVGELPLATQAKLLKAVEERVVMRLGSRVSRSIDVRFVAATNRDLEVDVRTGRFRQDLLYRLNAVTLTIPPLRQRSTEIEPLIRSFVVAACSELDRPALTVSEEAMRLMQDYSWPGNVRELKNVIERAVVLCTENAILLTDLPNALFPSNAMPTPAASNNSARVSEPPSGLQGTVEVDSVRFQAQIESLERARILEALGRSGGNQTRAAKLLGVSRRTLVGRMSHLRLPRPKKPDA